MKYILSVLSAICLLYGACSCQIISDWMIVEGIAPAQNMPPERAIKKAIESAKREAIEKYCGVNVRSQTFIKDFKLGVDIIDAFAHGYIVEAETLSISREDFRKSPKEPFMDIVKVKMKLKVARSTEKPDPYFKLSAHINQIIFQEGETIELRIKSSQDCYLYVFNITEDDKLFQIYPLSESENNFLAAGCQWENPTPLMALCSPGSKENTELLKIIATKKPVDFFEVSEINNDFHIINGYKVWKTTELGLEQLMQTIITIPVIDIAEKTIIFNIVKN